MAYSVKSKKSSRTYYLHSKNVKLKSGKMQRIYYFAGEAGPDAINALPEGYEVGENKVTGLPFLRKSGKKK